MNLLRSSTLVFAGLVVGCATAALIPTRAQTAPADDAVEYINVRTGAMTSQEADVEALTAKGREGWKLVATVTSQGNTTGYILMRRTR